MSKQKSPIRILFVCHGNICRSPMAEFAMKDLVRRRGLEDQFVIESAATTNEEIWNGYGSPVYGPARRELASHGIGTPDNELGVADKRARLLRREDYRRYDYIIGMDQENFHDMREICGGDPEGKITLLLDHGAAWEKTSAQRKRRPGCSRTVADPWYTGDFQATWKDVSEGCGTLLDEILRNEDMKSGNG